MSPAPGPVSSNSPGGPHRTRQDALKRQAGSRWQDNDLMFPSRVGTPWDASHVRREFRKGGRGGRARPPGVDPEGTTAQLRLADIRYWCPGRANSRLVGHSGTTTTEASTVCRSGLFSSRVRTPCIRIFPAADSQALSPSTQKSHPRRSQVACDLCRGGRI